MGACHPRTLIKHAKTSFFTFAIIPISLISLRKSKCLLFLEPFSFLWSSWFLLQRHPPLRSTPVKRDSDLFIGLFYALRGQPPPPEGLVPP